MDHRLQCHSLALHTAHCCPIGTQGHSMQGVTQPKYSRLLPPNLHTSNTGEWKASMAAHHWQPFGFFDGRQQLAGTLEAQSMCWLAQVLDGYLRFSQKCSASTECECNKVVL